MLNNICYFFTFTNRELMDMLGNSKSPLFIFVMICFIATIPSICSDIFVPSIPAISGSFNVSVDQIQLTISTLMCSFAFSQLIYGPVSQAFGRKKPLMVGILLIFAGTLICGFSKNIRILTLGHIIEGIGLGACSLFRAILRDTYDGKELRIKSSYANLLMTLFYPAAPMIGGILQVVFGWRSNFFFLALLSSFCFFLLFLFPETNHHRNTDQIKLPYIQKVYLLLLTHNSFVGYSLCSMVAMIGYFSWVLSIPLYIIKNLDHSPDQLGLAMLLISSTSILIGGTINNKLARDFSVDTIIRSAWVYLLIISPLPMLFYSIYGLNAMTLYISMWLYFFGTAFLWPNLFSKAFAPFQHLSGQAGSLYGNAQTMGGFFAAVLIGYASENTPLGLCVILTLSNLLSLFIYFYAIVPHQQTIHHHT